MNEESRTSRRFEPKEGKQTAHLRIKNCDHKVELDDISLGGFGISAKLNCPVKNNQRILLKTDYGWHIVFVRHVRKGKDCLLVGLELIEDVPVKKQRVSPFAWIARLNPMNGTSGPQVYSFFGVFFFVLSMGLICSYFFLNSRFPALIRAVISDLF